MDYNTMTIVIISTACLWVVTLVGWIISYQWMRRRYHYANDGWNRLTATSMKENAELKRLRQQISNLLSAANISSEKTDKADLRYDYKM